MNPAQSSLERLVRYRAGELGPEEHAALTVELAMDPDLRKQLARLERLDTLVASLPTSLPDDALSTLVERTLAAPARRPRGLALAVVAAVLVLSIAGWFVRPRSEVVVTGGAALVDGRTQRLGERSRGPHAIRVEREGSAVVSLAGGGVVLIPAETELTLSPLRLARGALVVAASGEAIEVQGARIEVDGLAVIAVEPSGGGSRVTAQLEEGSKEEFMKNGWLKLTGLGLGMAALGSGVTLAMLEGRGSLTSAANTVLVQPGEVLRSGQAAPVALVSAKSTALAKRTPGQADTEAPRVEGADTFLAMTKDELVAVNTQLRDEKEALLVERAQLRKKVEALEHEDSPEQNYYRFEPEELARSAKKGELRLRGPQLGERPIKLDADQQKDAGLTREEVEGIQRIYAASTARARTKLQAVYLEVGGDPSAASTLSPQALLSELRDKSLPGAFETAVRQMATERAGLRPRGDPATESGALKALRIYVEEDAWVLDQLDALLGPRRAEQFLNSSGAPKADWVFGVGPE